MPTRHLALFLGDEGFGVNTAASTTLDLPPVPDGCSIFSPWLTVAARDTAVVSADADFVPVNAAMDLDLSGVDLVYAAAVHRQKALRTSSAIGGDTWHALKVSAARVVAFAGAPAADATFSPLNEDPGSRYAIFEAHLTAALARLRAMGGDIRLDRIYWMSHWSGSLLAAPLEQDRKDVAKDLRTLMLAIRKRLELEGDAMPPISATVYPDVPAGTLASDWDMDTLTSQLIAFDRLFEVPGLTDTADLQRSNDLHLTGDSILQLGKLMSQVPSLPTGGPRILAAT